MSGSCCAEPAARASRERCPVSGGEGRTVKWTTVAALAAGPIPRRQEIRLCLDADCDVVYFGDDGLELRTADVRTVPGFKAGSDGLVCYCFLHSREVFEREARTLGASPTLDDVAARVKEGSCACEVRSPAGRCCLKEIQRLVERASKKGVA